jgi:hypothetical protein
MTLFKQRQPEYMCAALCSSGEAWVDLELGRGVARAGALHGRKCCSILNRTVKVSVLL